MCGEDVVLDFRGGRWVKKQQSGSEKTMIGEIYVTINDLREENKLLRKERRELVHEIEIIETKWKRRQEQEDWSAVEIIRKDCMLKRVQGNLELIEKSYLEKCHELQRNNEEHIELELALRSELKIEKTKRRNLSRKFSLLKDNSQPVVDHQEDQIHEEEKQDHFTIETVSRIVRTSDASIEACLPLSTSQVDPLMMVQVSSSSTSLQETDINDDLIRLMSEKNYWKNQTYSLRKEVMTLSNYLASGYRYNSDQGQGLSSDPCSSSNLLRWSRLRAARRLE
jgi:hypothetical protein